MMGHCKYNVTSSGYKTSAAVIHPNGAYLHGVILLSDATHTASLIIYDNATTNTGNKLSSLAIPANTTAPQIIMFNHPIQASNGIYADVTGTAATYIVLYSIGA